MQHIPGSRTGRARAVLLLALIVTVLSLEAVASELKTRVSDRAGGGGNGLKVSGVSYEVDSQRPYTIDRVSFELAPYGGEGVGLAVLAALNGESVLCQNAPPRYDCDFSRRGITVRSVTSLNVQVVTVRHQLYLPHVSYSRPRPGTVHLPVVSVGGLRSDPRAAGPAITYPTRSIMTYP